MQIHASGIYDSDAFAVVDADPIRGEPMWYTSSGDRTLHGAETRLFAESLLSLLDEAPTDQLDD